MCISVYLGVIVESSDNLHPPGRSRGYCLLRTRSSIDSSTQFSILLTKHISTLRRPTFTGAVTTLGYRTHDD